jgi:hypothetical protein
VQNDTRSIHVMKTNGTHATLLTAVLLLGGCVFIPVPRPGAQKSTTDWTHKARSLMAEQASREKVETALGHPDYDFPEMNVMGYTWNADQWGFLFVATDGAGYVNGRSEFSFMLWLAFDGHGRLDRMEVTKWRDDMEPYDQAARWRASKPAAQPPAAAPGPSQP